jgi:putative iron-dependent peroxidase
MPMVAYRVDSFYTASPAGEIIPINVARLEVVVDSQSGVLSDSRPFAEFISLAIAGDDASAQRVKSRLPQLWRLLQQAEQGEAQAGLRTTVGFSRNGWQRLFSAPMPKNLVDFTALEDGGRSFPATEGDILIFLKSTRMDVNFRLARSLTTLLEGSTRIVEDVQGFNYREDRDMIDFVDGTENPVDEERAQAVLIGEEDPAWSDGSYITTQRYVHDLDSWNALAVKQQEAVIGRSKQDNIEFSAADREPYAHINKGKSTDAEGNEVAMYRQNMPYGNTIENGTYFIGFAKSTEVVDIALRKMIIADAEGQYDHLLDYSRAVSGVIYFAPPKCFMAPQN